MTEDKNGEMEYLRERKVCPVQFVCTHQEREEIRAAADAAGKTITAYLLDLHRIEQARRNIQDEQRRRK